MYVEARFIIVNSFVCNRMRIKVMDIESGIRKIPEG
jgi:hypothetical protein